MKHPQPEPTTLSNAAAAASACSPQDGPLRLLVVDGPDLGLEFALRDGSYRVGKGPEAQLRLTDPEVSRNHLVLHVTARGVHVRDQGSKNGSFLGGARLTEGVLAPGTDLYIGGSRLRLTNTPAVSSWPMYEESHFGELAGWSVVMRQLFSLLEHVAATDSHVLIEGETGCGKELCARAIHARSARAAAPFVVCDVAGISRSLIESELFGHVKGAFTGASTTRPGAFVSADSGTLFIDELGELDLALQPRLLRALEERQVKPVGGDSYRAVDFRVIAATNRALEAEIEARRFRQDLFYRLAVLRVRLPPLRERKEDIPHLVRLFLGERKVEIPPESLALLDAYDWPGNVRELRNTIERGVARLTGRVGERLTPALLELEIPGTTEPPWPSTDDQGFADARDRLIRTWERSYLAQLLRRSGGNVSRAARAGGLERVYLHKLLRRHGLSSKDHK